MIILRISQAPHLIRVVAAFSLLVATAGAIVGLFLHIDTAERVLPAVSSLLYLIAPISVLRHLIRGQSWTWKPSWGRLRPIS